MRKATRRAAVRTSSEIKPTSDVCALNLDFDDVIAKVDRNEPHDLRREKFTHTQVRSDMGFTIIRRSCAR